MMDHKRTHRPLMQFIRKLMDVGAGYSVDDLIQFRSIASRDYPALVALMDQYIRLAEESVTNVEAPHGSPRHKGRKGEPERMHLFDLLRDRRLFSQNNDLAGFAERILPNVPSGRFGKISRVEIAARIVEYLETLPPRTRERLEASMRDALKPGPKKSSDKSSFLSKWEKIIKGIEL